MQEIPGLLIYNNTLASNASISTTQNFNIHAWYKSGTFMFFFPQSRCYNLYMFLDFMQKVSLLCLSSKMCLVLTWWPLLQDMLDDVAPTAAVENNISAAEVDCHHSTEKGQSLLDEQ